MSSHFIIPNQDPEEQSTYKLLKGSYYHKLPDEEGELHLEPGDTLATTKNMVEAEGYERWEALGEGHETMDDLRARLKILEGKLAQQESDEDGEPLPEEEEVDLNSLTIPQLKQKAQELDIDVSDCSRKEEYVNCIQSYLEVA